MKGAHLVLGNGLAGARVWPDDPPSSPVGPNVSVVCAVTRTGSCAKDGSVCEY